MSKLPEPGSECLYVIDLSAFVHRAFHTPGGATWAARQFVDMVKRIVAKQQPTHFAVAADLPWPTFREALLPRTAAGAGYKAQRKRDPLEHALILEQLRLAKEYLDDYFGFPVFSEKGFEADDIIATLTAHFAPRPVVIIALDKDMMQLVDGVRVVMWNGKDEVTGPPEVIGKFGIRPEQLRDYLALVGDKSDNVPGVPGMGPKAAVAVLNMRISLDRALEAAALLDTPFGRHRYGLLLRDYKAEALLSRQIVTLREDVPLDIDEERLRVVD